MRTKVVILGGGVAGMSAAHELAERGFAVDVYETGSVPGGKARSVPAVGGPGAVAHDAARAHGRPLPGEHGFRFFPGFYRHVIDTMQRIPFADQTVVDNLVDTNQVHVALFDRKPVFYPDRFPESPSEVLGAIHFVLGLLAGQLDIPATDTAFFVGKMFQIVSSCRERRLAEYEKIGWRDFVDATNHSAGYQRFFANGFTRSLVAAKAQRASAKTIGDIFIQMVLSSIMPGMTADRVLNGPTNDVWIDPWLRHLRACGVSYHFNATVQSIQFRRGLVRAVTVVQHGRSVTVEGDYFIAAVPVERITALVPSAMETVEPALSNLWDLSEYVEWMNGIQFYLTRDIPLVHGHSVYIDSPWALTSISQGQFWPNYPLERFGDGAVRGILSVCVSDWDIPGLNGKRAENCTLAEVKEEVWLELKRSLNRKDEAVLSDDDLHSWFIDPSIQKATAGSPVALANAAPLLVNYVDTWRLRPEAVTAIPNFFLASDYVRTYTDIATMEGANEAARRAVNGILDAAGSNAPRCGVWDIHEPDFLAPLRAYDLERFRQGLPWDDAAVSVADGALDAVGREVGTAKRIPVVGDIANRLETEAQNLVAATGNDVAVRPASAAVSSPDLVQTVVRILTSESDS